MRSCAVAFRAKRFPGFIFIAAALLVPLIPAWFSWQLQEKQFLRLKRIFPSQLAEQSAPRGIQI